MTDAHNAPAIEPRYLSQTDAARYLSVSTRTLRYWAAEGRLIPRDVLGVPRYAIEDLDAACRKVS